MTSDFYEKNVQLDKMDYTMELFFMMSLVALVFWFQSIDHQSIMFFNWHNSKSGLYLWSRGSILDFMWDTKVGHMRYYLPEWHLQHNFAGQWVLFMFEFLQSPILYCFMWWSSIDGMFSSFYDCIPVHILLGYRDLRMHIVTFPCG